MRSIGYHIPKIIKPLIPKHLAAFGEVMMVWPSIIGPDLATLCYPLKLTNLGNNRLQLQLAVHGPAAMQVEYKIPQLIRQIQQFGLRIEKITLSQKMALPLDKPRMIKRAVPLKIDASIIDAVATVSNTAIRQALYDWLTTCTQF